ncbi:energy transducer TonB [Piscinibacter gummiphilus]|uniref:Uncharacterized protein n=1 Tax=Piscinibacter gummiphilus TaxID=946333 RepID=A0A1W6L5W8_9BURK|nr:TonB family protein [Piscinibacter gummiphilus]ARN19596.1 hypothetical protein A4W93_06520 [Piscinibacter gummiphilus]ATU64265.1 energy transducer TonB [Piscinibacter gummiphilus]GLS93464.1 hypothetical protein GCM10007918_07550 [Piscinibacter gummiphilus]
MIKRVVRSRAAGKLALAISAVVNVLTAQAQGTTPTPSAVSPQAIREADNPLRLIIEAGKLKRRAKADEPAAAEPENRPTRAAPAPRQAAPKPAQMPAKALPSASEGVVAAESLRAPPPEAIASAPSMAKAASGAESARLPERASVEAPGATPVPSRLVQVVEPEIPLAVLRRMTRDIEVVVDFIVNVDGSVSDVTVRSSPIKAVEPAVVQAVAQWRYAPVSEARAQSAQLVLQAGP